ncbi:MAG: sigma-54 dependent transcriptional regulator [Pseudomonadota bacterium]
MSTRPGQPLVLVVDDEPGVRLILRGLLGQLGYGVVDAEAARPALEVLEREPVDVILTDLQMPGEDGLWLLDEVRRRMPFVPVVLLTAHGSVENAVAAMRRGAADFLTKPVDRAALERTLQAAVPLSDRLFVDGTAMDLVAESPAMRQVLRMCERMASSQAPVLITGPSGSGKEVVARALHELAGARRPFIAVNCAAIPEGLLESELFGHVKGAFTGATCDRPGRVELASGGTLFLDEIGDLPMPVQVKLLRLVQERTFERVGGLGTKTADIRILAATHRDLSAAVVQGQFREDLFFRLNVLPLAIPPLCERPEDVAPLARAFLLRACTSGGQAAPALTADAVARLEAQDWPGNARELGNLMERVAVLCPGPTISAAEIDECMQLGQRWQGRPTGSPSTPPLVDERQQVLEALDRAAGNRTLAARLLGVSRRTLYNKLERYQVA